MFDRTGWFGAAVLAATLAAAGAGCKSHETQEGGAPPSEDGQATTTEQPGGAPVAGGEEHPTGGGEMTPPPAGGEQTPAPPPAGGGETTQPAGAGGMQGAPADANTILLEVALGADKQPMVAMKAGADQGASIAVKEGEVPQQLVDTLKQKRESMMAAGQQPHVVITGPLDVPFDTVVIPVMKAAFRAGFQRSEVEYKPPK